MKYLSKLFLIFCVFFLASCASTVRISTDDVEQKYGYKKVLVPGGDFLVTTFQKITDKSKPYVFYIEGDGRAFLNKRAPSPDPTPNNKFFLKLALEDERPNVIYVARLCQYTPMNLNPKCSAAYWTNKRMSEDTVVALNSVINTVNNGKKFSIVGYSGGGAIAVLVAARNNKVKDITTIAGNLDHAAFTKYHSVPPMNESLNPIDYAHQVALIPQLHLSGGKDTRVPPFIAENFVKKASSTCVHHKIYDNATHSKGWNDVWESIYRAPLSCN